MRPYFTPEEQAEARDDQAREKRRVDALDDHDLRLKIAHHFALGAAPLLDTIADLRQRLELLEERERLERVLRKPYALPIDAADFEERELERMKGRFIPDAIDENGTVYTMTVRPAEYRVAIVAEGPGVTREDSDQPERSERP